MYKALKTAQGEIQETLLKFADNLELLGKKTSDDTSYMAVPPLAPVAVPPLVPVPPLVAPLVAPPVPVDDERMDRIEQALQFLHQKQNNQYGMLLENIQNLNTNLSKVVAILSEQTKDVIETATTIPNIQPVSEGSDLKTVCISDVSQALELGTPAYDRRDNRILSWKRKRRWR